MHKNNEFVQITYKQNAFCEGAVTQHHISEDLNPQNLFKFWPFCLTEVQEDEILNPFSLPNSENLNSVPS